MSPTARSLGQVLRQLRLSRQLSQAELAAIIGVHRTYLSGIERGTRNPTLHVLRRIADALRIRISELLAAAERLECEARRTA
jgi:transcriptional regulator with XRE-family HTH domain